VYIYYSSLDRFQEHGLIIRRSISYLKRSYIIWCISTGFRSHRSDAMKAPLVSSDDFFDTGDNKFISTVTWICCKVLCRTNDRLQGISKRRLKTISCFILEMLGRVRSDQDKTANIPVCAFNNTSEVAQLWELLICLLIYTVHRLAYFLSFFLLCLLHESYLNNMQVSVIPTIIHFIQIIDFNKCL
jgi:hypothetical protein